MTVNDVIVLEWLLTIIGGLVFLVVLGRPWRSTDPAVKWHLAWGAVVAVLQPAAFMLTGLSLVPAAVAEGLAMAIVWWRLALLIQTRRRARHQPEESK